MAGNEDLIILIIRLSFGALATFLAIILWAKTREPAWMMIILAVLFLYGAIMFDTFSRFGIILDNYFIVQGVSIMKVLFEGLPLLFIILGLVFMLGKSGDK